MNLQQFKDELKKSDFSAEAVEAMDKILAKAIERGELNEGEKKDLTEIISLEFEALDIEAEAIKNIKEGLNEYDSELEKAAIQAEEDLETLDKDFSDDITKIVDQAKIAQIREKIKGV